MCSEAPSAMACRRNVAADRIVRERIAKAAKRRTEWTNGSRKSNALDLHVPAPRARPGDKPDFSGWTIPRARRRRRARTSTRTPSDMRDMRLRPHPRARHGGQRARAVDSRTFPPDTLRRGLKHMLLTRAFDDRMYRAQRQGKTSFYMQCLGRRGDLRRASARAQRRRHVFPVLSPAGHPDRARLSARRHDAPDLFERARSAARAGSCRSCIRRKEKGFFTISGNLGTQVPQAVGWAMASAYSGDGRIAATWIGEGATAEGDFHAAMTFAAVYQAPVIINVVNNQWAISLVPRHRRRRATRRSPREPSATACRRCAWTATISSPSTPPRNGPPNAPAPISARR